MAGLKNLKKRRRVQIILIAAVALVLSTSLIIYAFQDGINFFRSPSQVQADPPTPNEVFRLGGMVEVGSLVRGQGEEISFRVGAVPARLANFAIDLVLTGGVRDLR